ncbi:MAG: hypothetical protein JWP91_2705 [Fibrobacteres bacterium]|nr:hypothetical protein [Fibrobacterota bacterium]
MLTLSTFALGETLIMHPGAEGKDASVFSRGDAVGKNYGKAVQFQAGTWTWDADNLGQGSYRGLIEFDLTGIPSTATVKSAKLHLYCDTVNYTKGHSSLTTSNAAFLMRVKEPWVESTVTWNNQPPADTAGRITLAKSKGVVQDYAVDVTDMIAAMVADASKNHGFLLRSITESPYNSLAFGSGDHADTSRHPMLEVEYEKAEPTRAGRFARGADAGFSGAVKFGAAGRELFLSGPATGYVLDLHGKIVARFQDARIVSLAKVGTGAYILRTGRGSIRFVVQ